MQCHNLGAKKIIARLRDLDYSRNGNAIPPEKFGVDMVIHPEKEVAKEIGVTSKSDIYSLIKKEI